MAIQVDTHDYKDVYCKLDKILWESYKELQTLEGDDKRETVVVTFAVYPSKEARLNDAASAKIREPISIRIPLEDVLNVNFLENCYNKAKVSNVFSKLIDV